MKALLVLTALLIWSTGIICQVPFAFNYQGIARDVHGKPLSEKNISLLISVVKGSEEGLLEFSEQHFVTTSSNRLFNIRIGMGSFIFGNLRNIDWSNDDYFIRTEMDINGGEEYLELGTTRLLAVPYALFALKAANAGRGSGTDNDQQTLSLNGTSLSIENGNSVDLAGIRDGVNDADADPLNELQTLTIAGNQLSISKGNTINLPGGGGNPNTESFWKEIKSGTALYYPGLISIGIDSLNPATSIFTNSNNSGAIKLKNRSIIGMTGDVFVDGDFGHYGNNRNAQTAYRMGTSNNTGSGFLQLYQGGSQKLDLSVHESGFGYLSTVGKNGNNNVRITTPTDSPNQGFIGIDDESGTIKSAIYVGTSGDGQIYTLGPNGNYNTFLTSLNDFPDNGYLAIYNSTGQIKAGIYSNSSDEGVIFADIKNFRKPHPLMADHDIVYASLEGPEAAAYLRGTATLVDGVANIQFPEHFTLVSSNESITVMITPLDAESKGLAVIKKSNSGFIAKELFNGQGNYSFDWEVKAVRAGYENYKVIRKSEKPRFHNQLNEPLIERGLQGSPKN
ncbi:MAG: hypothetical protein IPL46_20015 [Saprospiraceae bacterium]|nr:hypothetical protein [Saprospiraceae bacterium]